MDSYEVLKEAVDEVGAKMVASHLGVSTSLIYKWCQEPSDEESKDASGTRNPLDRLVALIEVTEDDSIISWLCHQNSGFFVKNPNVDPDLYNQEFIQKTQVVVQAFSKLLNIMSKSIADDNVIDENEAKQISRQWRKLKEIGEELVVACDKGHFNNK